MSRKIVIIGGGAASVAIAAAARKTDRTAEITVLCAEDTTTYSRCGLPYVVEGEVPSFESLVLYPQAYFDGMKIRFLTGTKAVGIDTEKKIVKTEEGESLEYDSLVIATGADALKPPIPGLDKKGVFFGRTIADSKPILSEKPAKAIVIGAKFVGLEFACALNSRRFDVTVVEMFPQILFGILDPEMAKQVQEKLEARGIKFVLGSPVSEILGEEKATGVKVGEETLDAKIVVVGAGVRANTRLAEDAGIALGDSRLIKIDTDAQTNVPNIYAAGDCAESMCAVTGNAIRCQLGTTAVRVGKAAGINAAGGDATITPVFGACVTRLFDIELASTGITAAAAKNAGIETKSATLEAVTQPEYWPTHGKVKLKLVAKLSGELVGAQAIGRGAGCRINYLTLAISRKMTVEEIAKEEFSYCPAVSEVIEPITLVSEVLARRLSLARARAQ